MRTAMAGGESINLPQCKTKEPPRLTQGCRSCAGFCIMVLYLVPEGTESQISARTLFLSRILYFRCMGRDELRKVRNLVLASA